MTGGTAARLSTTSTADEGRFPAGTLLAGRYRIIALLGRGGMGEVYRASDVKLGQPVAIKFLPEATAANQGMLARLHAEVRIARQVSHPNVCRVYDIGEVEGCAYITMEYVDGEDLASLLRRIGRLPADKATEIARRLCAGLAAAHDKGVLHRDLKPANIMIDGRGQVLITDFGLAGFAGQIEDGEIRNGTPAYMAPEQLAGKEVTVRSDLYALGLVLYEMYTGKQAFEGTRRALPATVSTLVKEIDPAVDRLIARCLEEDPRSRPASALAVAAALPGGDPLAAALAAGETPSPEMVAAAGEQDRIPVRTLLLCLGLTLAGLMVAVLLGSKTNELQITPLEKAPQALEQRARDLIQGLGYPDRAIGSAFGFSPDDDFQRYAEQKEKPADYAAQLAKGQPALLRFWYRQSPRYLEVVSATGSVSESDPPQDVSGMVTLRLDTLGRMIYFAAVPPQIEKAPEKAPASPDSPPDAKPLFAAAGLDPARFTPAEPEWAPLAGFDARAAWTGSFPDAPEIPLRIEAAWWRGRPVYFDEIAPWSRPARMQPNQPTAAQKAVGWFFTVLIVSVFAIAALLARRNFRQARGDARGSIRLAILIFSCFVLAGLCSASHTPTFHDFLLFLWGISFALLAAAIVWTLYMALEPYVRRRWPQSLISWSRLLAGGFRDPLVAGQLLIGVALGIGLTSAHFLNKIAQGQYRSTSVSTAVLLNSSLDARRLAGHLVGALAGSILFAQALFFVFFLLRVLFRRQWLAAVVWILLAAGLGAADPNNRALGVLFLATMFGLSLFILIRFGLMPGVVGLFVTSVLNSSPLTMNFSAWYAGAAIAAMAVVLALAAYAFHTALAGRPLFKEDFLEE